MLSPTPTDYYCAQHSTPETPLLRRVREETEAEVARPQMLSGALQGSFLAMLVKLTGAKNVVEIGTFTGYATLWMAGALPAGGHLHTLELDPKIAQRADNYFAEWEGQNITLHVGKAAESLAGLEGPFDFAFVDADKKGYENYVELLLPKMRAGGLIAADNVLFKEEVLQPESEQGSIALALHRFNQMMAADPRLEVVMLPIRDGISLLRKKG